MLLFIYTTVFINVVAFSIVFPLLPLYAKTYDASDFTIGLLAASSALAQILFSPLWGDLADRFGRKPIIAIGLLGIASSFFMFGMAQSIVVLFVARFLQGIFAGASMPAARAYVADVTYGEERTKAMGRVGAFLALGIILGPVIGGVLAEINPTLPFVSAAAVALVNFVFVIKFVPESLKMKAKRFSITAKDYVPFWQIAYGLKDTLMPLFILSFLWSFALSNNQATIPLLGAEKFSATMGNMGIGFSLMGIVAAIIQFFLLTKIASRFGKHTSIATGLGLMSLGFALAPLVPGDIIFLYIVMTIAGIGSAVARPLITTLISEETKEGQGITMGTANAFESFGRLVGPLLGGALFSFGLATPFIFSSVIGVLMLFFVITKTHFLKLGHRS